MKPENDTSLRGAPTANAHTSSPLMTKKSKFIIRRSPVKGSPGPYTLSVQSQDVAGKINYHHVAFVSRKMTSLLEDAGAEFPSKNDE